MLWIENELAKVLAGFSAVVIFALFLTFILFAYGALMKGHIGSVFFPEIPGRYATVKVTMEQGVAKALTERNTFQLEQAIHATGEALKQEYGLTTSPINKYLIAMDGGEEIELTAELTPSALAQVPSDRFFDEWRPQTGVIEGSYAVNFSLAEEPAGGTAITVAARSRDLAKEVANRVKNDLAKLLGVNDVYDDSQSGKRQLKITLNERGVQLGVDQRRLATLVGGAFGNIEVHRLLDKGEETLVLVRFAESETKTIEQLKSTPVMLAKDSFVSLGEISHFEYEREPDVLYRRNRDQVVSIYWHQNRTISSPEKIWEQLQQNTVPELKRLYPDVNVEAVGEFAELIEVQAGFKKAMLLTILLIYVLLAVPLKSYWQPFIIMSVIPFGFAGAILGHGIMGLSVSLLSMFGMMAMTGVVINDSLVLMTRFNQLYETGLSVKEALLEAGKSRLRAIFLTTVTTVCGLLPLLSETSEQAQYLKPAAVSLVFGELFATPITLILIPVLLALGKYKKSADKLS